MKARIQNELNRGNLTDEIANSVISALRYYKRHSFRFNFSRTTTTLTTDIEYYGLPTDFIEAYTMVLTSGDELDLMDERSYFWIEEHKDWANYKSRPYVFAIQADEMRFYPTPDKDTYTVTMTYKYELDEPTADTDTSAWFVDGEELIRTHAKVDLLENVIRGQESFQEAEYLRRREQDILTQLRREYKRSQSSGKLTPNLGRI